MQNIIVATIKEWNISNYFTLKKKYQDFNFFLVTSKDELTVDYIEKISPKYIFFPHWSWIIPKQIHDNFECIVFHMTDLPYGRGGSPLQNLIINEVYDTKISALKVNEGLDTGDIYLKEDFNIELGSAEEIFLKLSEIIFTKMIPTILHSEKTPQPQTGEVISFKRRTPEDSNLKSIDIKTISKLYDFVRMLDVEGYPKAYIDLGDIKIEFSECHLKNKKLIGRFEVLENE